ncbi:hypothetical protein J2X11_002735 [Aeromicrobium panaciterrae]|uniref:HNH nuclease domain-containing protein n=1 Tax=Aeromicrobium panaciterrae TaxID=363861 RepID=A0ABU1URT5_9ACTN|nr:DUF222 domain-containing protein [Aeromicrobium panaciterrae]MDR7087896.1 hypothetical protein [Aeromicrobium panaciterrae]
MSTAIDAGQEILDRIAAREVVRAKLEAETAADMLQFVDVRRIEAERHEDPRVRDMEISFAADELGVALHQPTRTVQVRLADSRRIRNLMPLTWTAYGQGRIDAFRVSLIASATAKLTTQENLIHLDGTIGDYAATHTTAQLKAKLNRFVATWETSDATAKEEQSKRSIWVNHQDDGMSFLTAYIPTPDALLIDAMLTERAKATSDDRTLDQRRADLFIDQLRGVAEGQTSSSRAVIGVTVPVTSLTGLDDLPGESFDGSFALPAQMVREMTQQPGTLWFRILTDPLGRILDTTEPRPFPSDALRTSIQARDGTCRFATCSRPSMESDLDHEIPRPDGPTNGTNLRALCRRHHNIKTHHIAEPTDFTMRDHSGARPGLDLMHRLTRIAFAA